MNRLFLENSSLRCLILPDLGGKCASLFYKPQDFETAAQPNKIGYQTVSEDTPFDRADASGIDDTFPAIDPDVLCWEGRTIHYTDHGEIWRSRLEVMEQTRDTALLRFVSSTGHYTYEKKYELCSSSLFLSYRITCHGSGSFPCIFTLHDLMRYEPDMRLIFPAKADLFETACKTDELGPIGRIQSASQCSYDFTRVPGPDSASCQKYYVCGPVSEGFCAYEYPSQKMRCELHYDPVSLPYLGFWVTAGGFRGDLNCALEPSNGYYDRVTRALSNHACPILHPGETMEFSIELRLKEL